MFKLEWFLGLNQPFALYREKGGRCPLLLGLAFEQVGEAGKGSKG